jgi:hypothetical protein
MQLYYHKTSGGAEYLFDTFIQDPNSDHKEGTINDDTKYLIRIDGDITKDAELEDRLENQNPRSKQLIKLVEIKHEAIKECLRANKDTLKQVNITTVKQCIEQLKEVETTDDWGDIQWHSGYVRAMQDAIDILSGDKTSFVNL